MLQNDMKAIKKAGDDTTAIGKDINDLIKIHNSGDIINSIDAKYKGNYPGFLYKSMKQYKKASKMPK